MISWILFGYLIVVGIFGQFVFFARRIDVRSRHRWYQRWAMSLVLVIWLWIVYDSRSLAVAVISVPFVVFGGAVLISYWRFCGRCGLFYSRKTALHQSRISCPECGAPVPINADDLTT